MVTQAADGRSQAGVVRVAGQESLPERQARKRAWVVRLREEGVAGEVTDEEILQELKEFLRELDVTLSCDNLGNMYLGRNSGGWIWIGYEVQWVWKATPGPTPPLW